MLQINVRYPFPALIILVFIALVTLLPSLHFMPKVIIWFTDGQRLLELLLLSIVLLESTLIGLKKTNNIEKSQLGPINNKLDYAFLVLLASVTISVCLAQSPRHAVIEVSTFAALSYLALFIARLYRENKQAFIRGFIYAIWAGIALYMVSFYVGYITACIFKTPLNWPLPFTGFSNIRSFNQYQLWTLGLICLPLLAFNLKNYIKAGLYVGLVCWWVLLFYSASRGVLIAWLMGVTITAITYQKLAWPFLRMQLISLFLGYCTYYLLFQVMPHLLNSTLITGTILRESTNDRIELWNQAILLLKSNPWFGVGPMHFAWNSNTNAHPHNSILQLGSEWGLPATLTILTIMGYGVYCWFKKFNVNNLKAKSRFESYLAIILFFTVITNAMYSLVDGVIVMPISQVLMFTMIGLMIGQYAKESLTNTDNYNNKFKPIFAGVMLVALVWATFPEISRGLSGDEKGFSMGYTALGPRYWKEIQ
jgi:putative inorganic carbon (hco3(-)) transporter